MLRVFAVVLALVLYIAFVAIPPGPIFASSDAICTSDPSAGSVGTTFHLTCSGYTPNSYVYAYLVEPSGAAAPLFDHDGGIKVNEQGSISYSLPSSFEKDTTLGTGTWHFVAEQLGLAHTVVHHGEVAFTITGGTEGVSGASLSADPPLIHKPEQGIGRIVSGGIMLNTLNTSEPSDLVASGMLPGEVVTFWVEPPNGSCASNTQHYNVELGQIVPGVGGVFVHEILNTPIFDGFGATLFDNVPADSSGSAATEALFFANACEGPWHFVARGNTSHRGGDAWLTVVGNPISNTASLSANPGVVSAMLDHISFSGSGFGVQEHVSCWITSPQGQVTGYPFPLPVEYSQPTAFQRTHPILSDASGNIAFDFVTGSVYQKLDITSNDNTGTTTETLTTINPIASEGALGQWAMSCRGDSSGRTAIAGYTVTGGITDP